MTNFFTSTGQPGSGRSPRAFEIGFFQNKNLRPGRPVLGDPNLSSHFAINLPNCYNFSGLFRLSTADYRPRDDHCGCLIITSKRRPEVQLSIKEGRPLSGQGNPESLHQAEGTANGISWCIHQWRLESLVGVKCPTGIPEECFVPIWPAEDQGSKLDEASVRLLVRHLNELSESDPSIPYLDPDDAVSMLYSDDEATPAIQVPQRQVADEDYLHGDSEHGSVSVGSNSRESIPGVGHSQADTSSGEYVNLQVDIRSEGEPQKRENSKQFSQDPSSSCHYMREPNEQ